MGNVLCDQFNALPHSEKEYWAHAARAKTEEIRLEVESSKFKLMAYGKNGPIGSIHKREIVNVEELFNLLSMGNSPLVEMWKSGNKIGNRWNWR